MYLTHTHTDGYCYALRAFARKNVLIKQTLWNEKWFTTLPILQVRLSSLRIRLPNLWVMQSFKLVYEVGNVNV